MTICDYVITRNSGVTIFKAQNFMSKTREILVVRKKFCYLFTIVGICSRFFFSL